MAHTTFAELNKKILVAEKLVTPGDLYYHYKDKNSPYKILQLCIIEATEEIGVLYQALADTAGKTTWLRPISNFLEEVEVDGKKIKRFSKA